MRVALRVSLIYAALVILLGVIGRLDMLSFCAGPCQAASFGSSVAFYILILPGLTTVGALFPYEIHDSRMLLILREVLALVTTAAYLFLVVLFTARSISKIRASGQA